MPPHTHTIWIELIDLAKSGAGGDYPYAPPGPTALKYHMKIYIEAPKILLVITKKTGRSKIAMISSKL